MNKRMRVQRLFIKRISGYTSIYRKKLVPPLLVSVWTLENVLVHLLRAQTLSIALT